jgi:hypothetical protein
MKIKHQMDADLKNANSLNDVLKVVDKYYDLDKPMGLATKLVVVTGVNKILKMINAKEK